MITWKIKPRKDKAAKNGKLYLLIQFQQHRHYCRRSLGIHVLPEHWNEEKQRLKAVAPHSHIRNQRLMALETRINKAILDAEISNEALTMHMLIDQVFLKSPNNDFFTWAETYINEAYKRGIYSDQSLKTRLCDLKKLQRFAPKLRFSDINRRFIEKYHTWMVADCQNTQNTCAKSLSILRMLINRAIRDGQLRKNPFADYSLPSEPSERVHLSFSELRILEDMYRKSKLPDRWKSTLRAFLFSCFTGLRLSEMQILTFGHIREGSIWLKQPKTKEFVVIPLHEKATALLSEGPADQQAFDMKKPQHINRELKDICAVAGISKKVSFHTGRHTFATNCLEIGIPVEVVSKLLGHRKLGTTMIYAKVSEGLKKREMEKWNALK